MLRNITMPIATNLKKFSTSVIPKEFGKKLSDLFRQANYPELIKTIESSKFKADPDLLKLKSLSYKLLSEEDSINADISLRQSNYFSKKQELLTKNGLGIV